MQLYDQFNRPLPARMRPDMRKLGAVSIQDRWNTYPSAGLTPGRLSSILRSADAGSLREQAELFEEMEEKDAHLAAILATRKLAVLGLEWQVEPASEDARDVEVAEWCQGELERLPFKHLILHLLDAVGKGYAAAEIIWEADGQDVRVGRLEPIHAKNIDWTNSLYPKVVAGGNYTGMDVPPFKMIMHRSRTRSGHDTRNGVLRVCAYMYMFKSYALKDWATFNEVFGMPMRLGKYDQSASQSDRDALRAAIASLGSDAAGIISKTTEIEFVEASSRLSGTTNPYQVMASFCNREMSKAVLGQTLTTDTEGSTGTYSAGKVQQEVRRDILEADAEMLAETLREQLLRPLVGFNFGWQVEVPDFAFGIKEDEDLKAVSETYRNLADMGYPLTLEHMSERFGVQLPEDGQELLRRGVAAEPPGPGEDEKSDQDPDAEIEPGMAEPEEPEEPEAEEPMKRQEILPLRDGGLVLDEADGKVIVAQTELGNLSRAAMAASAQAAQDMLAPVRQVIEAGGSLEEIQAGLLAAYPFMPMQGLGELIYQASMLAWMRGRLEE